MGKKLTQSKTFWVNALILAAGITGFVAGHEVIADYPQVVAIMAAVQGAVNIVLRLITSEPIK
jgi:hypothetical protein